MKRLLYSCALSMFILLLSCTNSKSDTPATSSNSDSTANNQADKNRANTLSVFRGIESGDLSVMDGFVADDAVDHNMMGDVKGRDSIKKMLADVHNHFTNFKMDLVADATNGEYHFSLIKTSGTTKDNSMGMPANTSFSDLSTGLERIASGKVLEHWRFVDPSEMMKMMNHMPMDKKAPK